MKTKLSIINFQFSILLLFAAILAGCIKDPVDNPDNPDNPVNVVMQDVVLTGTVKDAGGNPLSGVNVTTGSLSATTGSDGTFSFTQAGTVDDRAIVQFEKSGYFSLTRSGDKQDEMYMEPMMYRKGNDSITLQTTFDASAAKTLQVGGVKIELPASCFANANGSAYSGTVHADVLNLGSGNANRALMMPGGDLACDKSGEIVMPFGMMDAIFTDNAGNLLKIKDKMNIPISFPAPPGATDASVPLWTFDEARGVWTEEGSATLQGNVYTGTVSHFTSKAAGQPVTMVTLLVRAGECDNKPATGVKIRVEDPAWNDLIIWGFTDNNGECLLKIPVYYGEQGTYIVVIATYNGKTKQSSYYVEDINFLKPIVDFTFDDDCNDAYPEKLAVKEQVSDQLMGYTTYDNYGLRVRTDMDWVFSGVNPNVEIQDYINCRYYYSPHQVGDEWDDEPIDNCDPEFHDMRNPGASQPIPFISADDEKELSLHYSQKPDEPVAGVMCKVYANYDSSEKIYIWKRIVMREIENGEVISEILAITEDVPASAFTKTLDHSWIK